MANGRAYVQVSNSQSGGDALLAYDAGSFWAPPLWQQAAGCSSPSPTVHLGIVFVGSVACRPSGDDGGVRAVDGTPGELLWKADGIVGGSPAVAGGRVFVGTMTGQLQARSAATGALLWSRAGGSLSGAPAVIGGVVYSFGTENGASRLFARRADTGTLRWRVNLAGASSPAVADGLVYAGLTSGIGAWRLSDGVRRWRWGTITYGAPVVSGGRLYVSAVTPDVSYPVVVVDQFELSGAATGAIS